jgi:3-oxoacyl-[acyl-carrier protein] reductase
MKSLEDMSILITGGGSGIGLGTARYCIERGAKVTICGRRADKVAAAVAELGTSCHGVTADITIAEDRQKLLEAAINHGGQLDALVNNAGNMYRGAISELDERELQSVFHTNVIAAMMLTGLCTSHLAKREGSVVFVGSIHTRRAFPGASPYAATKAAVQGLTRVLAAELGEQKIRVNCLLPGAVFTEINQRAGLMDDETALQRLQGMSDLHALGRIGTTEEIAEAMAYLICAEWVTGAMIDIDGGLGLGITTDPAITMRKEQ